MQITHNNMLPGILTKEVEFFAVQDGLDAMHDGRRLTFEELPQFAYDCLRKKLGNLTAGIDELKEFARRELGGLDCIPDIDLEGNVNCTEYVDHQGPVTVSNGQRITPSEIRVLRLAEHPDKIIASMLFISTTTVLSHWQSMSVYSGETDHPIPWQTDHLIGWRMVVANAVEA